jgi:hypothetical protein
MNDPNVPMYRNAMIQVCQSRAASLAAPVSFFTEVRLSMKRAARTAATRMSGM